MAFGDPPVTIEELLTSAKKTAANIAANRAVAAQVAAQVRQQPPTTPNGGVTNK